MPTANNNNIQAEQNTIVTGVWTAHYTKEKLPLALYQKTGKHLTKAVKTGFGISVKFGTKDPVLLNDLVSNIWFFSAAKTYQQIRGMEASKKALLKASRALLNPDGDTISTFRAFRDGYYDEDGNLIQQGANQIFDTYNEDWLKSEYNTVITKSQLASKWDNIQQNKDVLPYLELDEVEDAVECADCAAVNGMTLRVDDPLLDEYYDALHFNCRRTWKQLGAEGESQLWTPEEITESESNLKNPRQPMFKMNPGKDRVIFKTSGDNQHPYFSVAKGDNELKSNNFNLPIK